ncbi:YcaO-like family protein [Actinomadura madurae]|uniref:YcaO-like family protein n=1 Tax=Actinomadura madurae TaxID=1993 RepID=UPI002026B751|nr:YcaO-like family protein [Actinomadura madurae]MCP9967892.1 YcaO-like family protein [Actinomadura madurae]MCP9980346.1 YcaO-like family protein [Actinomadura madurae]MCQ0008136.1 YcaO-like family protein [Actinomadura madurae]MCQ0016556.1 YcaO-like family protein [Actinomadura madurae]URN07329.1 YcaO-like family protein [Actinomadura madurae]
MRKTFRGGTDRAVALEESLARATALAEVAGITRLADITGLDRLGMPVHTAIRPAARSLAASQGKGLLPEAAKVSALMESLELWHAETHHLPFRFDSAADLRAAGEAVAEVEDLVHCACGKFRPGLPMRWVLGHDLPSGTATWVPYEVVHCDWRLPEVYGEHAFVNGSNGLASGNTLIEATVHGLCEVMERDAVAAFEDLGEAGEADRRVRADSVGDPDCRALLDLLRASGVESVIFDCTSDLGLATFVCWMVEVDPPWYHPLPQAQGAGAHPRREIALLRALTEAAQARASVIAGSRDDIGWERYRWYFDQRERADIAGTLALPERRDFAGVPHADHETFNADLDWLLELLAKAGARQAIAVDLTMAGIDLPVVKVVVPGLRWRP